MVKAPILLFTYKRLDSLIQTINSLQKNVLANESKLFIFSDGYKNENDKEQVNKVRAYLKTISGFKNITVIEATKNKGLANSIINGVSEILQSFDKVIVLEDDLVTSTNFLNYMNQALMTFENNYNVFSISGFTFPINLPPNYSYDNYFTQRASSWGWATWKNRWNEIDWSVSDYNEFKEDSVAKKKFNQMGSDMSSMLSKQMKGKINSWAIRWCYHQFKKDSYTVFPTQSKILNIGFGASATHTKEKYNRFVSTLDLSGKTKFEFNNNTKLDDYFIKQFTSKYSLKSRILFKLLNLIG